MKHRSKRLLSILLSLALMLGLLPGMSLTAFANEHTHNFEYSASGDTITATCQNAGCNLTENKVTLTIKAPENLYYNDTTASHAATLENLDAFNAATGRTYSADKIVYYKGGSTTSISNPKMATYTAKIAINPNAGAGHSDLATAGKFASVTFTFIAKPVEHTHSFSYTANGAVITATCTSTTGTCDLTNKQATLTLNAPEHTTYGDGKAANATFTGEIPGVTNPTINYRRSDTPLSSAPTDAGTYTAWCQLGNATASVEYTIGKATNNGWTTLPQAINTLVYTGQPQDLITAGVPSAGNALYTVGTDPDNEPNVDVGGMPYSGSVPKMTNAGTYYVWCKIDGGKNYTSIATQKIEVSIAKADITPSVSIVGWTYGETANTPMVGDTANPGNGEVTYTYAVKGSNQFTSTVPTAAGEYTVKAVIAETSNYKGGEATKDFTIAKATQTITADNVTATYGDTDKNVSASVTDPATDSGAISYAVKNGSDVVDVDSSTGALTIKKAGTATVTVTAKETDNYAQATKDVTVTVNKATVTIKAKDQSIYVGGTVPDLSSPVLDTYYTVTGLMGVDTLTTAPTLAYQKDGSAATPEASAAGTYDIVPSGATASDNYTIAYENGTLTISNRPSGGGGITPTTYKINVPESPENGTVTVNPTSAAKDKPVTITATPDEGYELDKIQVTDKKGNPVEVTKNEDGTYTFKMPASEVNVSATFKKTEKPESEACPRDDSCPLTAFTDLDPAKWYHDGIEYCLKNGLMNGVGNNKFDPNGTTSRGMIVTILYRLEGEPDVSGKENPFSDVDADTWYTKAVIWAAENKIVDGYGDGTFGPNDPITREQLAAILYRYAQFLGIDVSVGEDTNILSYGDALEVSDWANAAMRWAVGAGIINGKGGNLVPGGDASRAEAATMIQRFCENVAK